MNIGFAILRWDPADRRACERARAPRTWLHGQRWSFAIERDGFAVALAPGIDAPTYCRSENGTVMLGATFDREATEAGTHRDADIPLGRLDFATLCADLVARAWGGYVLIRADHAEPARLDIFRDPIGMVEAVSWISQGLRMITSRPEHLLVTAPPPDLRIDWRSLHTLLETPCTASEIAPLAGVESVPPGTWRSITGTRWHDRRIWHPRDHAAANAPPRTPGHLPDLVDACVSAWASRSRRAVGELSGGLDSAIVACGAARSSKTPVGCWFTYHGDEPAGDERRFARAVADQLGLDLVETLCEPSPIDEDEMATMPAGPRPGLGSSNFFHDRDLGRRAKETRADMIFTGQGGDALFYQIASPTIGADIWRGPRSLRDRAGLLADLAGWTGQSVWKTMRTSLGARLRPRPIRLPDARCSFLSTAIEGRPPSLSWPDDTHDLTPAKQLHLLALADVRSAFGTSRCSDAAHVVHPLLSQPLVEAVLPMSPLVLTQARRDRAAIRRAYAGRLPDILLERRGKGRLNSFFGRRLAMSTDFLRSYLLDGLLVANHVVDRTALEALLDPDILIRLDVYGELQAALLVERWARVWQARIEQAFSADRSNYRAAASAK